MSTAKKLPRRNPRETKIDALYRELHRLRAQFPEGSEQVDATFARLRALQGEEAAEMRERFEASLALSTGEGLRAVREAKKLLERD